MSRGFPVTLQIKTNRRTNALLRAEAYSKLSTQEKLDRLPKDGATKQRARLHKLLLNEK